MEKIEANLQQDLDEQQCFEKLFAEISLRYISLPADKIDIMIEDDQRRICECLGLDLSALWQWTTEAPRFFTLTHIYSKPGGPLRPEQPLDAQELFPWIFQKMLDGEPLAFSTENLPPEAARDKESRRFYGVKSSVALPLSVGDGPLIGAISFDTFKKERDWSDEIIKRLMVVAQIFTNALARKESERVLRKSEARLSLAADSAKAGLWELNCSTSHFWTTERTLAIFGYDVGEVISMEHFEQSVHPDDLELVRQAIASSLNSPPPIYSARTS